MNRQPPTSIAYLNKAPTTTQTRSSVDAMDHAKRKALLGLQSAVPRQTQFATQIQLQQPRRSLGLAPAHLRTTNSDFDHQQQGPFLQPPTSLLRADSNSSHSSASPEPRTNPNGGKQRKAKGVSRKKRKAVRACNHCQKSHLTCDDSRPCARCVKKKIGDTCVDGVRKKAKYLLDAEEQANRVQAAIEAAARKTAIAADYPQSHAAAPPPPPSSAQAAGSELNQP
ncbi:Transcriptional regulator of nonfermentable carbon utilization, partial [Coemansia sp. RSA 922]